MTVFFWWKCFQRNLFLGCTIEQEMAAVHRKGESRHFSSGLRPHVRHMILCLFIDFTNGIIQYIFTEWTNLFVLRRLYVKEEAQLIQFDVACDDFPLHRATVLQHEFQ